MHAECPCAPVNRREADAVGPCSLPSPDPYDAHEPQSRIVLGRKWARCVHGELRMPMWRAAVAVALEADVSPLCAWPDGYSAGIVDAITAFRAAREVYRADELRKASK